MMLWRCGGAGRGSGIMAVGRHRGQRLEGSGDMHPTLGRGML